jgi:carbamoylphosphate synthase large subunit
MTPEELLVRMQTMQASTQRLPEAMAHAAHAVTNKVKAPGVKVAAGATKDGVRVRVVSVNPRLSSRRAAARVKPVVVDAVDKAIRKALHA